jgi:hypothetical protein
MSKYSNKESYTTTQGGYVSSYYEESNNRKNNNFQVKKFTTPGEDAYQIKSNNYLGNTSRNNNNDYYRNHSSSNNLRQNNHHATANSFQTESSMVKDGSRNYSASRHSEYGNGINAVGNDFGKLEQLKSKLKDLETRVESIGKGKFTFNLVDNRSDSKRIVESMSDYRTKNLSSSIGSYGNYGGNIRLVKDK